MSNRHGARMLQRIVRGTTSSAIYWIEEGRAMCIFCSCEGPIAVDIKHDADCLIEDLVAGKVYPLQKEKRGE